MMKTLMTLLTTCAVLGMMSATAMAGGGGGAKGDLTTTVVNDTAPSGAASVMVVGIGAYPGTISGFIAGGAQFVAPGGTVTFSTPPGTITVTAVFVEDAVLPPAFGTAVTNVAAGTTVTGSGNVVGGTQVLTP